MLGSTKMGRSALPGCQRREKVRLESLTYDKMREYPKMAGRQWKIAKKNAKKGHPFRVEGMAEIDRD
jgi:hypothetical protein